MALLSLGLLEPQEAKGPRAGASASGNEKHHALLSANPTSVAGASEGASDAGPPSAGLTEACTELAEGNSAASPQTSFAVASPALSPPVQPGFAQSDSVPNPPELPPPRIPVQFACVQDLGGSSGTPREHVPNVLAIPRNPFVRTAACPELADEVRPELAEGSPYRPKPAPPQVRRQLPSPSVMRAEIEELRQRISERNPVDAPLAPLAASVDALSVSQRGGMPTFATFKFGYLPARGLLYSIIGHEVALFGLFLLFTYALPMLHPQRIVLRPSTQEHLVYLPEVGGGSEGEQSPGAGQSLKQEASAAPAHASKGFAYPGPQAILSDPPNANNVFQTVQRPLLVHPEPIQRLVPLPNIVQMAETRLPSDLIAPKPATPRLQAAPQPIRVKQDSATHHEAKFDVPVSDPPQLVAKTQMPKLPAAEQPLPDPPKIQPKPGDEKQDTEKSSPKPIKVTAEKRVEKAGKEAAPPSAAQVARLEMHGKALEPLVSLSPNPLPPGTNVKVPAGEARGRFAIAPGGTLNPNSITPGKPNGTPLTPPATGNENSHGPNAVAEAASNAGTGAGRNASAGGGKGNSKVASGEGAVGAGTGSGDTSGAGTGGTSGTGKGRGSAGKGAGTAGNGTGTGTGSGAGSGSGSGSFPGITIQGGEDASASNPPAFTIEPQSSYGMTVVSTASSGGGLEDFGVFNNERVFTVYISMKRSPEEDDPTWTLQYAVMDDTAAATGQVLPPSAVMREWPEIPAGLEKKYAQHQVVISAIIDKDGKVGRVAVKRTPDPRVSESIAQALAKWVFRPAQVNGRPVVVKVLLGIPLG